MIFHDQIFTGPDVVGDCWRTCIACLLDLQVVVVPHFAQSSRDTGECFIGMTEQWLGDRGFVLKYDCYPPNGLAIATGQSPRSEQRRHAVIVDGTGIARDAEPPLRHDPHPSRKGLVSHETYFWIEPMSQTPQEQYDALNIVTSEDAIKRLESGLSTPAEEWNALDIVMPDVIANHPAAHFPAPFAVGMQIIDAARAQAESA